MRPTIQVEGAKEVRRALNRAADKDLKAELRTAHREAAKIVATQAKVLAPKKSGTLASTVRPTAGVAAGYVRAGRSAVPYAGPIHFGWPRRNIRPQPFLYDAADRRVDEVLAAYRERVQKVIDKVEEAGPAGGGQ